MEVGWNYDTSLKNKIAVLTGTAITTGVYVGSLVKKKKCSGSLLKKISNLELGIKEGIGLCTASTIGGLATGLIVDKPEHRKYKLKDTVNQMIGNTLVPFGFLALSNKLTKKLPILWQTISGIATLIATTFLGHSIANKVNEKIFKEESGYKCTGKDFYGDFDDFIFAASTVMNNKSLYKITASLCTLTYMTHGYLAGCRQKDKEKKLDKII